MPRPLRLTLTILLSVLLLLVVLAGGVLVALRVPSVQTRIAHTVAGKLSDKLGFPVTIGRVDLRPFSRLLLVDVRVLDRQGGELFNIGRADADIAMFSVLDPTRLHVDQLILEEPRFALVTYAGSPETTNLDQFLLAVKRLVGPTDTTKASTPFELKLSSLGIRNGRFVLDRQDLPREPSYGRTIDYGHMRVDSIYGDFHHIKLIGDTIATHIGNLRAVDTPSGTRLHRLDANMVFTPTFWEFAETDLHVGRSHLQDYVRFDYKHFLNFVDFNDSVKVTARLGPTRVYSSDIAKFAPQPEIRDLNETVLLSGEAKGYVRKFSARNLDIRYGKNTHVVGNVAVEGLPDLKESFVDMRLKPSVIDGRDIRRYVPAGGYAYVQRLGRVRLQGQFLGFYNDFVANGAFRTALGDVVSDVNIKFKTDPRYSTYEGQVKTTGFQLGKLLGDETTIRDLAFNGRVEGVGFTPEEARLKANANVQSIWLQGYRYRNIVTNGQFRRQAFEGKLAINDPNLQASADGSIDLNRGRQAFDLKAKIRKSNLRALGLTKQNITLATTADVEFEGLQIDNLIGSIVLRNSTLGYNGRTMAVDTFDVYSRRDADRNRRLAIRSELADLTAVGNFSFTRVARDVKVLLEEYRLNFESNDAATAAYYRRKRRLPTPDYSIALDLYLKRPNPALQVFVPGLKVSDYSRLDGSFRNGNTSIFSLGGHITGIQYDSVRAVNTDFEFTTSKLPYQPEVLAQANITSERQRLPGLGKTEKFYVEGVWDQERINFSTSLAQTGTTNKAAINGSLEFLPRAIQVVFRQSGVNLLGKEWTIAAENSVIISGLGQEFDIKNLTISNGAQQVSAQGFISADPSKQLQLAVSNFDLNTLSSLTQQRLAGRVNANGTLSGVYGALVINSKLGIDSLKFDNTLIGDVRGQGDWDNATSRLLVDLDVLRDQERVVRVAGTYAPRETVNQLNLTGVFNKAPIKLAEPLLNTLFRNLRGTADGTLRLTGRLASPILSGNVDVSNGRLTFIYLGTTYSFSDRIRFAEDRIAFRNVSVRDVLGNTGTIDGNIFHRGFEDMRLDLRGKFRKLQVLNTTRKDNELYFGTAYATGEAEVYGTPDNLTVNVTARSEAGTRMSLPFDNAAKAEQASYIRFVNHNLPDTVTRKRAVSVGKVDLSGIKLNFNLSVTEDAYVEILLDESTGDVIRGAATGQLRMNIDTRGEFNMYGQIEIVRGAYNFTLQGLVNKEFVVRPGGTISWNGDPLAGEMNVTAAYTQRTSLAPILSGISSGSSNSAVVPVTAVMNLTGPILLPSIKLGLEFNDAPSGLEGDLADFVSKLRNDEQELNRQVFSLLVFKQLSPQGQFTQISLQGRDNTVSNSLGQVLSTQLGLLTSQIDQNLEIDFNINGITAEQLQQLQVRLSYSLLNGRLRVTREGGFTNTSPVPGTPTTGQASLVGDISLEYYLRPDGKFRAKLRYETTPRGGDLETIQTRAGVSVLHTEQFDTLEELFARKRLRRRDVNARKAREVLNVDDDPRTVM
ncbi:translocation/assembly module TamB domain-containing protein [Hymenobacter sp. BT175]|uniref:translocation/assembly module TamB domain-containing protein n=1 Tax=Hymenobacter translucens TaxID=2886507 RepID=UPI001D0EC580|nr:translocation/assembly module TamB domain-containing protein [Hymenobacter translucens]MCC2547097.1 translocation/assembly module TamB domain-containing protein [Hymenobacter translucens]